MLITTEMKSSNTLFLLFKGDEKEQPAVNNAEDSGIGSLGQCSDTVRQNPMLK